MRIYFYVMLLFVISFVSLSCVGLSLATDGFVAYRSNTGVGTTSSPKIQYWDNTANGGNGSWSGEITLPTTYSPIRNIVLKQSSVNSKIVVVAQSDNGNLTGYVCMHDCTVPANWVITLKIGLVGVAAQRRFDLTYESVTGDLLLVYGVVNTSGTCDIAYKVLPENTESFSGLAENCVDDGGHGGDIQYSWIALDSDPVLTSEEIIILGFDFTDTDINSWVWNGNAVVNYNQLTNGATATGNLEVLAVKYAADGSKGMVAGGTGTTGAITSSYWNGAWNAVANFDVDGTNNNDTRWITMKADPSNDDLQMVFVDNGAVMGTAYWNGAAPWLVTTRIATPLDIATRRTVDFSWLPSGGTGQLVWDNDGAGVTLSQRTCTPQCNVAGAPFANYAGTGGWMTLFRNPTSTDKVKFLGLRMSSIADIGSFWYDGSAINYFNYGDVIITTASLVTYEDYGFDFKRDVRQPNMTFISPSASGFLQSNGTLPFNISTNEYLSTAILDWNGTNYTMDGTARSWNYTFTDLGDGFYTYKIYATDLAGNMNISEYRNITIDFPPNITIIDPQNNTLNTTSRNITFYYNVTDGYGNVSSCSLIIDKSFVINTSGPINETSTRNFTYILTNGQHNWSVWCNDSNNVNSTSEMRNITIRITPIIDIFTMDDGLVPDGEIILNAGSTRFVNCSFTATDPEGYNNLVNATATFYYFMNLSGNPNDNNTHYTNVNCTVAANTSVNKTFTCGFDVLYYANNGTWNCNITVINNYSISTSMNLSNMIDPLYAVNITDGIDFANVSAGFPSNNITVNITNFGNMPVNITLQGYALVIGDKTGMNCSDNTNITITNIRFATNNTASYAQKIPMNGSIQSLNFKLNKQINVTQIFNTTYWQVNPDPGTANRLCSGYVIFSAESP